MILELLGTILDAFWDDFRALFLSLLRVLWKPASSSVLVVLWDVLAYIVREVRKIAGIAPDS